MDVMVVVVSVALDERFKSEDFMLLRYAMEIRGPADQLLGATDAIKG